MGGTKPCRCQGTNENCMFCFGAGVLLANVPLIEQTLSTAGGVSNYTQSSVEEEPGRKRRLITKSNVEATNILKASKRNPKTTNQRRKTADKKVVRAAGFIGFVICENCGARVKESRYASHLNRRCPKQQIGRAAKVHQVDRNSNSTYVNRPKVINQNKPLIFNGLFDKNLDATMGYAHAFRENGRFGSHPSHDGFGDDSNP